MILSNEKQETMFDTSLTIAVEKFMEVFKAHRDMKEALPQAEKELFEEMRKANCSTLHIQDGPTLSASCTPIKNKITVKEYDKKNTSPLKPPTNSKFHQKRFA